MGEERRLKLAVNVVVSEILLTEKFRTRMIGTEPIDDHPAYAYVKGKDTTLAENLRKFARNLDPKLVSNIDNELGKLKIGETAIPFFRWGEIVPEVDED